MLYNLFRIQFISDRESWIILMQTKCKWNRNESLCGLFFVSGCFGTKHAAYNCCVCCILWAGACESRFQQKSFCSCSRTSVFMIKQLGMPEGGMTFLHLSGNSGTNSLKIWNNITFQDPSLLWMSNLFPFGVSVHSFSTFQQSQTGMVSRYFGQQKLKQIILSLLNHTWANLSVPTDKRIWGKT